MGTFVRDKIRNAKALKESKNRKFSELWARADIAGSAAVDETVPVPMVVEEHANQLDDNSPIVRQWHVPDGPCGFAWINIKPGNSAFANWLKTEGIARKDHYYGGVTIWIRKYGQSVQLKEKYATAAAQVLSNEGVQAYASSRLD